MDVEMEYDQQETEMNSEQQQDIEREKQKLREELRGDDSSGDSGNSGAVTPSVNMLDPEAIVSALENGEEKDDLMSENVQDYNLAEISPVRPSRKHAKSSNTHSSDTNSADMKHIGVLDVNGYEQHPMSMDSFRVSVPGPGHHMYHQVQSSLSSTTRAPLREHQQRTIDRFMAHPEVPGLLMDHSLGSGKTLTAIALATQLCQSQHVSCPIIVVTLPVLVASFRSELYRACGHVTINFSQWIVVSHRTFARSYLSFPTKGAILIIDEGHMASNYRTKLYRSLFVCAQEAWKTFILTGTVVTNRFRELAPLVNLILASPCREHMTFISSKQDLSLSLALPASPPVAGYLPMTEVGWTATFPSNAQGNINMMWLCRIMVMICSYYRESEASRRAHFPTVRYFTVTVPMKPEHYDYYTKAESRAMHTAASHNVNSKEFHKLLGMATPICPVAIPNTTVSTTTGPSSSTTTSNKSVSARELQSWSTYLADLARNTSTTPSTSTNPSTPVHMDCLRVLPVVIYLSMLSNVCQVDNTMFYPKIFWVLEQAVMAFNADRNTRIVINCSYVEAGSKVIDRLLTKLRMKSPDLKHVLVTGATSSDEVDLAVQSFNAGLFPIFVKTDCANVGLSLKGVRLMFNVTTYWSLSKHEQPVARGARYNSHIHLPEDQRIMDVYDVICTRPTSTSSTIHITPNDKPLRGLRVKGVPTADERIALVALSKESNVDEYKKLAELFNIESNKCVPSCRKTLAAWMAKQMTFTCENGQSYK